MDICNGRPCASLKGTLSRLERLTLVRVGGGSGGTCGTSEPVGGAQNKGRRRKAQLQLRQAGAGSGRRVHEQRRSSRRSRCGRGRRGGRCWSRVV